MKLQLLYISDSEDDRRSNYVYQLLMSSDEGEYLIRAYDKERELEEKQEEHGRVFKLSCLARCIIYHEWKRTRSYE